MAVKSTIMRLRVLVIAAFLLVPGIGRAQPQVADEDTPPVDWIRPEEVPARADELLRRLEAAPADAGTQAELERITREFAELRPQLDEWIGQIGAVDIRTASLSNIEDLRRELGGSSAPLSGWERTLTVEATRVAGVLDEIEAARRRWIATRDHPETAAAGEVVARRVRRSLAALDEAEASLRAWRQKILAVSDRLIDRRSAVADALKKIGVDLAVERTRLFVPDSAPLWRTDFVARLRSEIPQVPEEMVAYARGTAEYAERDLRPLLLQGLLAVVLMIALRRISMRARQRFGDAEHWSRALRLLERPFAIALLLALLATPMLHPLAPQRFVQLMALLALFPAARILMHVFEGADLTAFGGFFLLFLLDRMALALATVPTLARTSFLLGLLVALALAFWFVRRIRLSDSAAWMSRLAHVGIFGLVVALLAEIGGWTALATLLGRGILASITGALYIYAAVLALEAVLAYALASPTAHRSHAVHRSAAVLQGHLAQGLRWLGALLWVYLVLGAVGLRSTAAGALQVLFRSGVHFGALSISLGDVLAFVLTLVVGRGDLRACSRHRHAGYGRAQLGRRRGRGAERRPGVGCGDELDALRSSATDRGSGRCGLRNRPRSRRRLAARSGPIERESAERAAAAGVVRRLW